MRIPVAGALLVLCIAASGYARATGDWDPYCLGLAYADGRGGVTHDDAQAVTWLRKPAEFGRAGAQNALGVMYMEGRGVAQDDAQAVDWFRKAAEQGYADAQFNLGVMYAQGRGVARDDIEAIAWYRKAGEQGDAAAAVDRMQAQRHGRRLDRCPKTGADFQ